MGFWSSIFGSGNEDNEGDEHDESNENSGQYEEGNEGDENDEGNWIQDGLDFVVNTFENIAGTIDEVAGDISNSLGSLDGEDDGNEGSSTNTQSQNELYNLDPNTYTGTVQYNQGSSYQIVTQSGFTINVSIGMDVPRETIDSIISVAIAHAEGVYNGEIPRDGTRRISDINSVNLQIENLPVGQGFNSGSGTIIIDPTYESGNVLTDDAIGGVTVHEFTHLFNPALQTRADGQPSLHQHAADFYELVQATGESLGVDMDQSTSGTRSVNYDPSIESRIEDGRRPVTIDIVNAVTASFLENNDLGGSGGASFESFAGAFEKIQFGMNLSIQDAAISLSLLNLSEHAGPNSIATHMGTSSGEEILGTAQNDVIVGLSGNDHLRGGDGADIINGGSGNDILRGAGGNDIIDGGAGDDFIRGGGNWDIVYGGTGNDTVLGDNGVDYVELGEGNDKFNDNDQNDKNGHDEVYGGDGRDVINGGGGNDIFFGDAGNDRIFGGIGNDTIDGGLNNDIIDAGSGNDKVWGGLGIDRVTLGSGNDVFFDSAQGGNSGRDTVTGGAGNDVFNGGGGNDTLTGGSGADRFLFNTGNDDDTIRDFDADGDTLVINGTEINFASLPSSVSMHASGSDVVVSYGSGDTITLSDNSLTDL